MAAKKRTKPKRASAENLSGRRAAFLREYLVSRNATQAAIKAGYSERTAYSQGQRLLKNVEIHEAVRQEDERALAAARVTRDAIVGELARIAFSDPRNVMTWGPDGVALKTSAELSSDAAAAVSEVSQTISKDGGSIRLKMHSKVEALKELAEIARLYPKDAKQAEEEQDDPLEALSESLREARAKRETQG